MGFQIWYAVFGQGETVILVHGGMGSSNYWGLQIPAVARHYQVVVLVSIGIDLGKTTFHLVGLGEHNKALIRKKFSRAQLLAYTANLPFSLIGLEACSGAHFIGTALREQRHKVRLIPAQFIKPYRKSNKNDFIDGEAIAEAVTKESMRFVEIKTDEQLDVQAIASGS